MLHRVRALAVLVCLSLSVSAEAAPRPRPPAGWGVPNLTNGRLRTTLSKGNFVGKVKANASEGINASKFRTVALNGEKVSVITKGPGDGALTTYDEVRGEWQERVIIPAGTLHLRNAAASGLADVMKVPFVPVTVRRVIGKTPSSVQVVVPNAIVVNDLTGDKIPKNAAGKPLQLNRAAAEKLRVFDFIVGNRDRHGGNMMVYEENGELMPVAIDNDYTFPEGPIDHFAWPAGITTKQTGKLLDETLAFISSIDSTAVARSLVKSKIPPVAIRRVLLRIELVKKDPSFLELSDLTRYQVVEAYGGRHTITPSDAIGLDHISKADAKLETLVNKAATRRVDELLASVTK
jgi:hypothetical protein